MDNEVGVVFLPCGHLISCVNCAPSLKDCPVCRQSIHGTVKTYMSWFESKIYIPINFAERSLRQENYFWNWLLWIFIRHKWPYLFLKSCTTFRLYFSILLDKLLFLHWWNAFGRGYVSNEFYFPLPRNVIIMVLFIYFESMYFFKNFWWFVTCNVPYVFLAHEIDHKH